MDYQTDGVTGRQACRALGQHGSTPRYKSKQPDTDRELIEEIHTQVKHRKHRKYGNKLLRALLVEVTWMVLSYNAWARETYKPVLRDDPSCKKLGIVPVARRSLVRFWAMCRNETP